MQIRCKCTSTNWLNSSINSHFYSLCWASGFGLRCPVWGEEESGICAIVLRIKWVNTLVLETVLANPQNLNCFLLYVCLYIALKVLGMFFFKKKKHITISTVVKKTHKNNDFLPNGDRAGAALPPPIYVMWTLACPMLLLLLTQLSSRSQSNPASGLLLLQGRAQTSWKTGQWHRDCWATGLVGAPVLSSLIPPTIP